MTDALPWSVAVNCFRSLATVHGIVTSGPAIRRALVVYPLSCHRKG